MGQFEECSMGFLIQPWQMLVGLLLIVGIIILIRRKRRG